MGGRVRRIEPERDLEQGARVGLVFAIGVNARHALVQLGLGRRVGGALDEALQQGNRLEPATLAQIATRRQIERSVVIARERQRLLAGGDRAVDVVSSRLEVGAELEEDADTLRTSRDDAEVRALRLAQLGPASRFAEAPRQPFMCGFVSPVEGKDFSPAGGGAVGLAGLGLPRRSELGVPVRVRRRGGVELRFQRGEVGVGASGRPMQASQSLQRDDGFAAADPLFPSVR